MAAGVRLEDGPAHALEVGVHERAEKNVWIRVVVGEGRFHLVKRLCEAVGLFVQRLYRPEFAGITVEGLRSGEFRPLTAVEVKALRQKVGLAPGEPRPQASQGRKLPRAARRHGHGPPPAPGTEPEAEAEPKAGRAQPAPGRNQGGTARTKAPPDRRVARKGSSKK
jgi:23S rRNA pseudouridine2605 synthase